MKASHSVLLGVSTVIVSAVSLGAAGPQQPSGGARPSAISAHAALLEQYCVTCHNERLSSRGTVPLELQTVDLATVPAEAELWEKVIRKLRTGSMPPAGRPRPDAAAADSFASWLETEIDQVAAVTPNPGRTESLHRLNRTEYQNAIRDLLALDIDAATLVPADDQSYGFDNIAGVLKVSPTLLERYMSAAREISRLAVGASTMTTAGETFRIVSDLSQYQHRDGLPFGTRGGTSVRYNFPRNGEYDIKLELLDLFSGAPIREPHQLEVSVDGCAGRDLRPDATRPGDRSGAPPTIQAPTGSRSVFPSSRAHASSRRRSSRRPTPWRRASDSRSPGLMAKATSCCISRTSERSRLPDPSMRPASTTPLLGAGSSSASRQTRPRNPRAPGRSCLLWRAAPIVGRSPGPMWRTWSRFYEEGRTSGGFETGIERALRALLVSPHFLFRVVSDPPGSRRELRTG